MISAVDALQEGKIALTPHQEEKLAVLDAVVTAGIRKSLAYRGVAKIRIDELDLDVIAAMDHRLRGAGWEPEWLAEQSKFNKAMVGNYLLNLNISRAARDEYEERRKMVLA